MCFLFVCFFFLIAPSEEQVLSCCALKTSRLISTSASNSTLSLLSLHSQIYKRTHHHDAYVLALTPSKDAWPPSLLLEWLQSQLQGPMNEHDRIWSLPVSVLMDPALKTHSCSDFHKACLLILLASTSSSGEWFSDCPSRLIIFSLCFFSPN